MFSRGLLTARSFLFVLVLVISIGVAQAAYRYQDDKGQTCFTDDWRTIPVEYRASAEPPVPAPLPAAATKSPASTASPAPPPPEQPEVTPLTVTESKASALPPPPAPQGLWGKPEMRIGAYVVAAIAVMALFFKLVDFIPSPMVGRLILLAVFLGVVTYGYKLYVESMVDGYFALKKKTTGLMERAMKRETTQLPGGQTSPPPAE